MSYVTQDGDYLKTDKDFEAHKTLDIHVDVEYINIDGALTTGLIQEFTNEHVKINDHFYNRKEQVFVSRPHFK